MHSKSIQVWLFILSILLSLRWESMAAPANDNFTNRLVLSGSIVSVTNDNSDATFEPGEKAPAKNMAKASLWYQWTAPTNGLARAVAAAKGFVPAICVYQGSSIRNLKKVANSLSQGSTNVFCSFQARAGSNYLISVDGLHLDGRGTFLFGVDLTTFQIMDPPAPTIVSAARPPAFAVNVPDPAVDGIIEGVSYLAVRSDGEAELIAKSLQPPFSAMPSASDLRPGIVTVYAIGTNTAGDLRVTPPLPLKIRPRNDNLDDTLILQDSQWKTSGYTAEATREKGEPSHGSATVWWTWTAPTSGRVEIEAQLGETGPLRKRTVNLYIGPNVTELIRIPWESTIDTPPDPKYYYFNAISGLTYRIAVCAKKPSLDPGTQPFRLHGRFQNLSFDEPILAEFTQPVDVPVEVSTVDDSATIERVDFLASDGYANNQLIASLTTPPYRFIWSNTPPGNYALEARAIKLSGSNFSAYTHFSVRPLNDNFSNRIVIETNFSWLSGRIAGATREPGEPAQVPTAWWSWTAPEDGELHLSDPDAKNLTGFAIYTGTNLTSLTVLTNQNYPSYAYNFQSKVKGGTTYQIAAVLGPTPDVHAQLRFYPPPLNDNFSNRFQLSGSLASFEGYTVSATSEPNDPGGHTIWWTWDSPGPGSVTVSVTEGTYVYHGTYTGSTLDSLQPAYNPGSYYPMTFETVSNTTYQIVVIGDYNGQEHVAGNVEFTPVVTNDWFATRTVLDGTNLTLIVDNYGACTEAGEPPPPFGGSGRTIWWSWTAPADGMLYLKSGTIRGTTMLQLFKGDNVGELQTITDGGAIFLDQIWCPVFSNETYQIRFDAGGLISEIPVKFDFVAGPSNDQFTNATVLTGTDLSTNGTVRGASPEPGDPLVWNGALNTVWYSWTAPQSGNVIVAVADAADFYALQAFTGPSLSNLTVAGVQNPGDTVFLNAQAGTTYYFAIAGFWMWEPDLLGKGPFRLLITSRDRPSNDNFINAEWITGTSSLIAATNWGATLETNDPPIVNWNGLKRTLWYRWQAPASGILVLTDAGSSGNPVAGVYLGTDLNQLGMIGEKGETPVRSNEIVHILVDQDYGQGGEIRLELGFLAAPPNDDFAQAILLTGTNCSLTGNVHTATGEVPGFWERGTYQYRDIWWKWTAPRSGHVVLTNLQSDASPSSWIYTGTASTNLQLITWLENGWLQFDAAESANYWIRVSWGLGADIVNLSLTEQIDLTRLIVSSLSASIASPPASPQLKLISPRVMPDGQYKVYIQGPPSTPYRAEYSNDLVTWQLLQTGVLQDHDEEVIDAGASTASTRFYRLR